MILGVFFPSLMGFGILVSGALLLADVVNRLLPHRGRRRRHRIAVGAHGIVNRAASATGRGLVPPAFLIRQFRNRTAYLAAALVLGVGGVFAFAAGLAAHADVRGVFYRSPWAFGLGVGFGIALGVLALGALVLAVGHRRLPRWVHQIVGHSPLGRLRIPPRGALTALDHQREE
jgi:hypothetical protein